MKEEPGAEITLRMAAFLGGRCLETARALSRNQRTLAEVSLPRSSSPLRTAWFRNVIHLALQSREAAMEKALGNNHQAGKAQRSVTACQDTQSGQRNVKQ